MYRMGNLYYYGRGVQQDYKVAMDWYLKGAGRYSEASETMIGTMYWEGHGVEQNYSKAVEWYQKNEKYSQDSQFYLGRAYEEGKGVLKDLEKAKSYYRMAAGKGQVEAKKALERLGE